MREFPTGISVPAFGDGTLFRDLDKALVEQLDKARYLFFVTQPGQTGSYLNDSHQAHSMPLTKGMPLFIVLAICLVF